MQKIRQYLARIRAWFQEYKNRLILAVSYLLIAILCFEAGWLRKSLVETQSVTVQIKEAHSVQSSSGDPLVSGVIHAKNTPETKESGAQLESNQEGCQFVGSKKSNKYHQPESRCAAQIKPENRVCFSSREVAEAKHYVPGCLQ